MIYDAVLLVSFGGPERREDVIPFLRNITRGRNIPEPRLQEVAQHYYRFGGKSPINDQNRALRAALSKELTECGLRLPVYWGNRNWRPLLADSIRAMKADGVRAALAFVTSAYSSYSGCRQYLENIARARDEVGEGAPQIDKLPAFYDQPGFIEANAERVREAMDKIPVEDRHDVRLIYSAHSIPLEMARNCRYVDQLHETCRLISSALGRKDDPLVFQSRSGRPGQPWLEPDILDYLRDAAAEQNGRPFIVAPVGFTSDHMEIVYDLDIEARALCDTLNLRMTRAATVGVHPAFVRMIRQLIQQRVDGENSVREQDAARRELCAVDCCLPARAH